MFFRKFDRILTGIEISEAGITVAQVEKEKSGWRLLHGSTVAFPEEVITLSYKEKNIVSEELFRETIRKVFGETQERVSSLGVSIPNEIVKISIQKFEELPRSKSEIEKMIAWEMEKTLHFPMESTKISYHMIDKQGEKDRHLLVTAGILDVINDYENNLIKVKLLPRVIRPAGINQYNFFQAMLPERGVIAFLGLYEKFFTFFVFENGGLAFYHGVKKGFSDLHFFQDVDMTMQHYFNINPDREIEKLFVGSQVAFHQELKDVFKSLSSMDVSIIEEAHLIKTDMDPDDPEARTRLSSLSSAIGAAQSLST
jgi:Tfp pilus assembly PilM family ATPase